MQFPIITSPANPLIKQARALRQKKERLESGLFLVEGIHHVGEVVDAQWQIEAVLYAPELLTSVYARGLISRLSSGLRPFDQIQCRPVSAQVMESLADKENPQGILAIVRQRHTDLDGLPPIQAAAALVSPQDPGNVGTILRTLDAINADALFILDGGVDLYHPSVIRASMGALFWKPVVQTSFAEFVAWGRDKYQLIGTSARASRDYHGFHPKAPWILILGNEQKGLSAEQIAACNVNVSLPMKGRVSSLNLAVAAGILLYQFASYK
jgi:TrmH family RNA methyltransferase